MKRSGKSWRSIALSILILFASLPALAQSNEKNSLAGSYKALAQHPGVFTTQAELEELAKRINTQKSYSQERFAQLAAQVARDLDRNRAWDKTYSGCDIETYLYSFSYEAAPPAQIDKIRKNLSVDSSANVPTGAAVVASRAALYAALAKVGAALPPNAPEPGLAASLAKRILLAWSDRGFRDASGRMLSLISQFCIDGKISAVSEAEVGLQISRGVIYSVQAQDLLMYLNVLDDQEIKALDTFHAAMYELIRNAHNFAPQLTCNIYNNQAASRLAALLATARLLDDKTRFEAALFGNNTSFRVDLPWITYFSKAIYGNNQPPNGCYPNTGPDGLSSQPFFQIPVTVLGEIDDRFRNKTPAQGIGYPMLTLERIYDSAEILRLAGFDPYRYRGEHGQSIEAAVAYYACYAKAAGFEEVVTPNNAHDCPDFQQYVGKSVENVDRNIVIGAYRFPKNKTITDLEAFAKSSASKRPFSLDAIYFGRWRG